MKNISLILFLLYQRLFSTLWSQSNYPVYVSPSLIPPYSLKLSDYGAFGSQRLMVTIVVNDLDVANLPVKLRIKMETAGVTIENPPTINTTPIFLDGGSATILFGEELADYFSISNLQFKGYSKEAYRVSGQLPEGFYRFTVEVLHFHTNRVISNAGTTTAWIALGKPPVLRMPANDVELGEYAGMPITFSWLSSSVGSPVSAGSIRYRFEMWEMRIPGISPYSIAASMPVFHEHTTGSTFYSLNPASLMMEEGMSYVWRVTAYDESGFVPFEQDGHSQMRTFSYKSLCRGVTAIETSVAGQKGSFVWVPEGNHTSYNVEVRNNASGWFSAGETFNSKVEYYELERGQTYELRVQSVCNGNPGSTGDFSEWTALTIPDAKPRVSMEDCPGCGCDDDIPKVELTNFELRRNLSAGDTLSNKTGTTRFIVRSAEPQGDGIYKGLFYFWAEIWGAKILCEYWDLQVNSDNVIVNMDYKSIDDPRFLLDVDAAIGAVAGLLDNVAVLTSNGTIKDTIQVLQDFDYIEVKDGQLVAIVLDENGYPVPTPLNISVEEAEKALITNGNGDEAVITSKGEVMGAKEYQATGGGNSRLMKNYNKEKESNDLAESGMVEFSAHPGQKYGFDAYTEQKQAILNNYPTLNNGYRPAFKSVESFGYDKVGVSSREGLTFRDEMGVPAADVGEGVSVRGSNDGSVRALYAYRDGGEKEEIVGKLNVMSFDNRPMRVYIIPVNKAKLPAPHDLERTLNDIYRQAVTTWTVVEEPGITISFPGGKMTHGGSGDFSTYNDDQKLIVETYTSAGRHLERNALYLFFVEGVTFKERSIAGFMPLQRQAGFIYDNPGLVTVAHELAHGAFNLRHTFSPQSFIVSEGQTQNLMDYTGGTELWQHQWKSVQDPQRILFSWAQDEEEGEYTWTFFGEKYAKLFNHIYDNNKVSNLNYLTKIKAATAAESIKLEYTERETRKWSKDEKVFIDGWEIGTYDGDKIAKSVFDKIQQAKKDKEIESINLSANRMYIGRFPVGGKDYPVAVYAPKGAVSGLKKITVTDSEVLERTDTIKHIYCDETYTKYLIIALYKDGAEKTAPSLIIQIEKFVGDDTKDKWLKYLGVLVEESVPVALSDTIKIYITRTHTGSNSTSGVLRTDDGTLTGYTVELPRGTDNECKTICTDNKKPFDCHCIAEGIYNFEINTKVYDAGSIKNHSLRIISTVPDGRTGVLVHGGRDDAKGWSQGCILPMPNSPETNSTLYSPNRNNTEVQSVDFTKEILDWVRLRESEIKKKNKDLNNVVKQIIITKTF